jgi:ferredoxin
MLDILEINNICIKCDNCRIVCPENAVIQTGKEYRIESWSCTLCGFCIASCPVNAIKQVEYNEVIDD